MAGTGYPACGLNTNPPAWLNEIRQYAFEACQKGAIRCEYSDADGVDFNCWSKRKSLFAKKNRVYWIFYVIFKFSLSVKRKKVYNRHHVLLNRLKCFQKCGKTVPVVCCSLQCIATSTWFEINRGTAKCLLLAFKMLAAGVTKPTYMKRVSKSGSLFLYSSSLARSRSTLSTTLQRCGSKPGHIIS